MEGAQLAAIPSSVSIGLTPLSCYCIMHLCMCLFLAFVSELVCGLEVDFFLVQNSCSLWILDVKIWDFLGSCLAKSPHCVASMLV
jgi:hypothetical protein